MSSLRSAVVAAAGFALTFAPAMLSAQRGGPSGTLVVSNMNDNTATVVDASTGRVIATLPTGEGPHEVAISRDGRWALVSNYGVRGKPGNTITVIDVTRAAVARTITLTNFQRPHGMAFFPGDTTFAVTSEVSQAVVIVDFRDGHVVKTLPTQGRATHMLAMTAKGDLIFTANIASSTISVLDPAQRDSAKLIAVGRAPEGIATAPDGSSVWVGSNRDSIVVVMESRMAAVTDTVRGFGLPYRMAFTPNGRHVVVTDPMKAEVRVFTAANRRLEHTIAIPRDSLVATAEVPGSPSPEGIAISADGRFAFVTLQGRNRVATIDLDQGRITAYAPTGVWSDGIGYSVVKAAGHEHLTEVACVDVPPGEKRPEFGCFNVGVVTGLHFGQASVYWHLRAFPSRKLADAAKSATGIVVEEDGRVWLSEFGPRNVAPRGGEAIAVVGPLQLPAAQSYAAVLSYAVMRPGDNSRVHIHPGPEGWYVLAGEQCLETPAGANRARAGGTMTVRSNTPMELNVTGKTLRRAFALVIHDSTQERGKASDWKPPGACGQ